MMHTLTIVSHTHWDREWYQPYQEYRIRLVQLVDRLLDLLEQDPEYRYFSLDGQTIILEDYLEVRPEREQELREHIREGRLLIGPWYILPDEFLVSPEATIRNLILGDRTARAFGAKMTVGYVPDCFGHISQLPQILRGFGLDTAALWRGVGEAPNEFLWAGPDGSQVLTVHLRDGYGNAAHLPKDEDAFADHLSRIVDRLAPHATTPHLLAMNGTDHLEPMPELSGLISYASAHLPDLKLRHGTLPEFVAAVRDAEPTLELRVGELRSAERAHLLPGVFSARTWIKQRNAHCETLLEKWAEPFSVMVALHGLETPTPNLPALCWQAWRYLILNHPHDSICGCSVDAVHKEMDVRFDWVEQIGEEVTRQSLAAIAQAVDTTTLTGSPLIVFNPMAGPRSDLVTACVPLPEAAEAVELLGPDGVRVPCEVVSWERAPDTVIELDRHGFETWLARILRGPRGGESIQIVETMVEGDMASVEVTLALLPPVAEVVERCRAAARALLADQSLHRFRLHLRHQGRLELRFVAPEVPAHGHKAFAVRPIRHSSRSRVMGEAPRIENDLFLVEADPARGTLTVTDKASGVVFPQLLRFVDGGDRGDEYNYCPPESDLLVTAPAEVPVCRVVESGPVRQTLEISQIYHVPAGLMPDRAQRSAELVRLPITTRVSLLAGVPRIDFSTTVENKAMDHRLRVHLPTPIVTAVSHAEGHFDVLERPLELPRDTWDWPEQPTPTHHQRTFVDVNDGRIGLMVANRGLPEYEVIPGEEGVTVALTLLRCVGWLSRDDMHCRRGHAGPALPTPGAQCLGTHTFEYALIPHRGGWENACAQAHAFNAPLRAVAAPRSGGPLPLALSSVQADPPCFVITAVKLPEEGEGLIVRGFNITDEPQEVTLRLDRAWRRATRVGLDESFREELALEGNSMRFCAGPKQIVTLRFAA